MPVRNAFPICEIAAGCLRPAFQDMADKAACAEEIIGIACPAEFMHQDAERERRISTATGDDYIRALIKGRLDRQGTKVSICRQHSLGQWRAAHMFADGVAQVVEDWNEVIAFHDSHGKRQAKVRNRRLNRPLASGGIDSTGIGGHADALCREFR